MSKKQFLVLCFLIVSCISALAYSYFFHSDYVIFHSDNLDPDGRQKMAFYMGVAYFAMTISIYGMYLILSNSKKWFIRINNWVIINAMVIIPSTIFIISKYYSVPILFSLNNNLMEVISIYINGNIIYLLVKGYKRIKDNITRKAQNNI